MKADVRPLHYGVVLDNKLKQHSMSL
jgi:hypothetical protein